MWMHVREGESERVKEYHLDTYLYSHHSPFLQRVLALQGQMDNPQGFIKPTGTSTRSLDHSPPARSQQYHDVYSQGVSCDWTGMDWSE